MLTTPGRSEQTILDALLSDIYGGHFGSAKRGQMHRLFYYKKNLENIGYRFYKFNSVANFYDLLFATSHERGIDFWNKATLIRFDGQRKLL